MRLLAIHLVLVSVALPSVAVAAPVSRPNILWILAEDICPDIACYGTKAVKTPNLDRLAAEGVLFKHAYSTAPVCSASRSAMMVGMYQHCVGAHQHRTSDKKPLRNDVHTYTQHLRAAGYYACTEYGAKTDLNFTTSKLFDGKGWKNRKLRQPFICQATIAITHRTFKRDKQDPIDPKAVEIPPYYPDHPLTRRDWADYLESMQLVDKQLGKILKRLEDEKLADSTVVVFLGDHGRCHVRGKQFLYDGGLHVPLIIRWPGHIKPGTVREDLVSAIDVTATLIAIGLGSVPSHMQGRDLFAKGHQKRRHIFAARGKMDDTHDAMRAVRSKGFKYILNLMPERAYCQLNEYKERQYPILALLNVMHLKGQLNEVQDRFMAARKPPEELYDLEIDPHETKNLANDPTYAETKQALRAELSAWRKRTGDHEVSDAFRKGGWSAKYPTRSLKEWEQALSEWEQRLLHGRPAPKKKKRPKQPIKNTTP
jgi:arylsulfatase A-like enzyme